MVADPTSARDKLDGSASAYIPGRGLTLSTICDSSKTPGPTIRGPRDCAWVGISSCSPVYFGFGSALAREVAMDVMVSPEQWRCIFWNGKDLQFRKLRSLKVEGFSNRLRCSGLALTARRNLRLDTFDKKHQLIPNWGMAIFTWL